MNQAIGERPDYGAFIPSQLDDYGLNPFEFRVFCHISRRAGTKDGGFYESDVNASKICRMELKTYRKAKHALEELGMISIETRPGKTAITTLKHHKEWIPTPTKSGGTKSGTPTKSGGTKSGTPTKSGGTKSGGTKSGTPTKSGGTPLPNQVLPNQAHKGTPILKGNPLEGNPLEEIKENDFFQKSDSPVEKGFSDPTSDQISALRAELETQETPELHRSSTLALAQREEVPPPHENHSQIIKTAADVKSAVTRAKAKKMAELADRKAKQNPDAAEAWWTMFRTQALQADCKPGSKADALASWDLLHEIDPDPATLYERIIHGTELYWERELKRDRPNCKHGVRFLEKRDWQEALDWAHIKSNQNSQPAQRFARFLMCWNQDRPLVWPEADEGDLSPKCVGRLEELIASCDNSLERFQKALWYCKRDPYWGLQRSETLEDFLYSGRINEFYKKQIHHEKIGLDKTAAPDRKTIEAAAKKEASRRESISRLLNDYHKGEISKEDLRACFASVGIDPDLVPEAC